MKRVLGLMVSAVLIGCGSPEPLEEVDVENSYERDLAFLREHTEVVELVSGNARVAVVPVYQGRVMTSTNRGEAGPSFGWINYDLIRSGEIQPHINVFGGEDRFWMGPEGGQFSIFFAPSDPFDLEHWQTPACIDTEPYEVVLSNADSVRFRHAARLTNYSGTSLEVGIERTVRLLSAGEAESILKVSLGSEVEVVAFESDNRIANTGPEPWTRETGLLSIWILGMFNPSPRTTAIIPYHTGPEEELGPVVNDAYFGKVPADRLVVGDGVIFFRADGEYRSKIGLPPQRATGFMGSWDGAHGVLTLVAYDQPDGILDYVNSMWEIQDAPFRGDALNSYNDGPPAPGEPPLGPFYELESSSPAAALTPGGTMIHRHRTLHLTGTREDLDRIAKAVLGTSLDSIPFGQ